MVELCFSRSGDSLKDVDSKVMPSFVEQVSSGLEGVAVIGYSGGGVSTLFRTLWQGSFPTRGVHMATG